MRAYNDMRCSAHAYRAIVFNFKHRSGSVVYSFKMQLGMIKNRYESKT